MKKCYKQGARQVAVNGGLLQYPLHSKCPLFKDQMQHFILQITLSFFIRTSKIGPYAFCFQNFHDCQGVLFLIFILILIFFLHNIRINCNTRNQSNDATEKQKEIKTCFNVHFQYSQSKIKGLNKMLSLTSLAMLNCESRTSLHVAQCK